MLTNTEALTAADFTIFPNPTEGDLTVLLPNTKLRSWRLVNVLGQVVISGVFREKKETVELSSLGRGMFWLEVEGLGVRKVGVNK